MSLVDTDKLPWYPSEICKDFEQFESEANRLHSGKFKYFRQYFRTRSNKTVIQCTICNSYSYPIGLDHLKSKPGSGCKKCFDEARGLKVSLGKGGDFKTFISQVSESKMREFKIFEDTWSSASKPFKVKHLSCGKEFYVLKENFLRAEVGCKNCADKKRSLDRKVSVEELKRKFVERHGLKYDYSMVLDLPRGMHTELSIFCNTLGKNGQPHGQFSQIAYDHLSGHGCDKCGHNLSNAEIELQSILAQRGLHVETRSMLSGIELDLYLPEYRIAIEINGLRWHSEEFKADKSSHLKKTLECGQFGIRLIHIWEDEWLSNKDRCISWVLAQCGISDLFFNARELNPVAINWNLAKELLDRCHIQGAGVPASYCYGLIDPLTGQIVSAMCFDSRNTEVGQIELTRFCSDGIVRGGFSKLLKFAIKSLPSNYKDIISFSDRRWSLGKVYELNGFTCEGHTEPLYWWVKRGVRHHRRWGQHSNLKKVLLNYDPLLSETQNCHAEGYFRLWDCGRTKWKLSIRK